jgi:hypothetical protein
LVFVGLALRGLAFVGALLGFWVPIESLFECFEDDDSSPGVVDCVVAGHGRDECLYAVQALVRLRQ